MIANLRLTPEDPTHGSDLVACRVDPRAKELVSSATDSEYSEFGDSDRHRGNVSCITMN